MILLFFIFPFCAIIVRYSRHTDLLSPYPQTISNLPRLCTNLNNKRTVHETAHWILTKIHGFRSDSFRHEAATSSSINGKIGPANISVSQAGQSKPDYLIAIGQRPDDAGARATDMLIGATSKVVSFADGESNFFPLCFVFVCFVVLGSRSCKDFSLMRSS